MFSDPGIKYFLSERIQQDPIEKYFGRQRQRGRVNENPTVAEYMKNEQALRVISSIKLNTTKGNTRGTNENHIKVTPNDYKPLCKRRKKDNIGKS